MPWRERVELLVPALGQAAGKMLTAAMLAAEKDHARNAKDYAVACAVVNPARALLTQLPVHSCHLSPNLRLRNGPSGGHKPVSNISARRGIQTGGLLTRARREKRAGI